MKAEFIDKKTMITPVHTSTSWNRTQWKYNEIKLSELMDIW